MKQIAKETLELLRINDEWVERYDEYSDFITKNIENGKLEISRKSFHEWEPLKAYISTTNAKNQGDVFKYSLRYLGQHVAELKVNLKNMEVKISTDNKTSKTNKETFGCDVILNEEDWNGSKAREFRRYFREELPAKKKHIEHLFESLIISEMIKKEKTNFIGTKPIMLGNTRFSMPTPLRGSDADVKYSAQNGGGIDILARTRMSDGSVRLNIVELKDDNTVKEPPQKVIRQAIKYTVFIQQLLRSKSGQKWWELFGFSGEVPSKLILNATCLVPSNEKLNDTSFACKRIAISDGDEIELHYIYFDYEIDKDGQYSILSTKKTSF